MFSLRPRTIVIACALILVPAVTAGASFLGHPAEDSPSLASVTGASGPWSPIGTAILEPEGPAGEPYASGSPLQLSLRGDGSSTTYPDPVPEGWTLIYQVSLRSTGISRTVALSVDGLPTEWRHRFDADVLLVPQDGNATTELRIEVPQDAHPDPVRFTVLGKAREDAASASASAYVRAVECQVPGAGVLIRVWVCLVGNGGAVIGVDEGDLLGHRSPSPLAERTGDPGRPVR